MSTATEMTRPSLHILYEHGWDFRPFGSAQIRLLRPFSHPALTAHFEVSAGRTLPPHATDLVILDRLWRPDITLDLATAAVAAIRRRGSRFVYALDDDFLSLRAPYIGRTPAEIAPIVEYWLAHADVVLVTTAPLAARFAPYNPNCVVVPNALDERLLAGGRSAPAATPFGPRPLVIGCMGTRTHDDDFALILPAWQAIHAAHGDAVEFQMVGVTADDRGLAATGLPIRPVRLAPGEADYPAFMLWFTSHVMWDIAVAPLADTPFNHAKSDIKFLDYSALGAAGIYSDVAAYQASVRHGETGWLVENSPAAWAAALERLLADEPLRLQTAANARRYLHRTRTVAPSAPNWLHALINAQPQPQP